MTGRPPLPLGTWGRVRRYEVAPGRWRAVAQYRDYDGRTRQVERHSPLGRDDDTGARAERVLVESMRDRAKAAGGAGITGRATVERVVREWLKVFQARSDRKASTKAAYEYAAQAYVIGGIGGVRLSEITVEVAERFLRTIEQQHGPGSAKHARAVLSGALATAARFGAIDTNPIRDTSRITGKVKAAVALDDEELTKVIAAVRADSHANALDIVAVVEYLAGTGVRIGECLALRFADVDLHAMSATVTGTVSWIKGSGAVRQSSPKTAAGYRVIALPLPLVDLISERTSREWPHNELGLVFPNSLGRPRDPNAVRKQLNRVMRVAELPRITPHTFRRTVATKLDKAGLSARQVADHLGHSQISMTTDKYMARKTALPEAGPLLALA